MNAETRHTTPELEALRELYASLGEQGRRELLAELCVEGLPQGVLMLFEDDV